MAIRLLSSESINGALTLTGNLTGTTAGFSGSITASGNSNSFGNTTIGALAASTGTFSASVTAAGNSNSFGTSTFTGNISGVRGFFNSGATNVVATFTSTDGTATLQCADPTGNVEFGASGNNFVVQPAGGVAQLTVGSSSSTFAGNVKLTDEKILGLRTSTTDYALQYRDLDFRLIGSADGTTQRKFSFGYYTSDNPAGTWNGKTYINSYTGSVGIGTDSPDEKLDVENGNIRIKSNSDGNTGILRMYDAAGTESGQIYPAAGDLRFYTPNDIIMSPTGNVGIGTTSPSTKLEIFGNNSARNTLQNILAINGGTNSNNVYSGFGMGLVFSGRDYSNQPRDYAYIYGVQQASSTNTPGGDPGFTSQLTFYTNTGGAVNTLPTQKMVINALGNVGINVANPGFQAVDGYGQIGIEIKGGKENNQAPCIRLHETGSGKGSFELRSTRNILTSGNYFAIAEGTDTFFAIRGDDDGGGTSTRGYVGIGTESPVNKLDIRNGELTVRPSSSGNGGLGKIGYSSNNSIIQLYDSSGNEDVRISTSLSSYFNGGNVGIGTTSPSQKLDVQGNVNINGTIVEEGSGNNKTFRYRTPNSSSYSGGNALITFGRFYWTPAHWVDVGPVLEVTLQCKYYSGYQRKYIIKAGYANNEVIINELQPSDTEQKITLQVGAKTAAGYNYAGQPVYYVDLQWTQTAYIWGWAQLSVQVPFLTSNPTSGWGGVVVYSALGQNNNAGTPTNHASFFAGNIKVPSTYNLTTGTAANMHVDSNGFFYRSTSSLKYKTDVRDYDKGLKEVMQLQPKYYKGKDDGNVQFAGLIAEDVHDLGLTEFVQYADDETPDALAYPNMIALLTKAIQELKAEIELLKNK